MKGSNIVVLANSIFKTELEHLIHGITARVRKQINKINQEKAQI